MGKKIPELSANCKDYYSDKPKNNQVFELKYRFTTKRFMQQLPKSNVPSLQTTRNFTFEEGSGCKSLIEVQGKQTQSCQMDFGEFCEAEIQAMSRKVRPSMTGFEDTRNKLEQILIMHGENEDMENFQEAKKELTELHNFVCCTST